MYKLILCEIAYTQRYCLSLGRSLDLYLVSLPAPTATFVLGPSERHEKKEMVAFFPKRNNYGQSKNSCF